MYARAHTVPDTQQVAMNHNCPRGPGPGSRRSVSPHLRHLAFCPPREGFREHLATHLQPPTASPAQPLKNQEYNNHGVLKGKFKLLS